MFVFGPSTLLTILGSHSPVYIYAIECSWLLASTTIQQPYNDGSIISVFSWLDITTVSCEKCVVGLVVAHFVGALRRS